LWEQLQFALDGEPDPWFDFERAQVDLRQFQPVAPAAAGAVAAAPASAHDKALA
jgi:nitrite reductase (NADH) large subunit